MAGSGKLPNGPVRNKENSPFTPGNPVPVELFVGRAEQIEAIRRYARQACTGRMENVFLTGDRGIGKSSLARFVTELCRKDCAMLGVHAHLGGVTTVEELVRRVFEQLLKEAHTQTWFSKIKGFFGNYIKEVGLLGVSVGFAPPKDQLEGVVRDFPAAIKSIQNALQEDYKGLIFVLDDLNGLADQAEFANWYKSFVDHTATQEWRLPVLFILCGLPERRDSLARLQPSLMRIFRPVEIERLSDQEVEDFFEHTFQIAGIIGDQKVFHLMARHCSGLPTLMHEVGDAVFWVDSDGIVDWDDVSQGLRNAAEEVGKKYLDPMVYRATRSKHYLEILGKIANAPRQEFCKQEVEKKLNDEEKKVFHNFLRKFRDLGVIESVPGHGRGVYRFVNQLFFIYINMQIRSKSKIVH
ncbi:MAG: ATP-binding protein [Planctomycetes bacterium]|nr:ATP-binding protein [Planctomycetota bacterium]MBU4400032.1 ATP-binding protein [Planctomycetota bacterium]MCG2684764.1 ATP-binding protein [Planctomycetales bacterium]